MDMKFGYKNCPNIALNFFNFLDYLPKVIFLIEQIYPKSQLEKISQYPQDIQEKFIKEQE